ncbi:choice-of-anchor X domain-containing protein [Singulisphaera rosea]
MKTPALATAIIRRIVMNLGRPAGLLALASSLMTTQAVFAGPTAYDKAEGTFDLTYTYASVPTLGMPESELERVNQPGLVQATPDQDAKMKAIIAVVSKSMLQATNGRARIGRFDYVDSIKKADIIISLNDAPGRAGYATRGAIEGKPGQLVLFYKNYETDGPDDFALTAFHEINHYLFALPDEYLESGAAGNCPLANPSGPGCIMDNYHKTPPRFGWYGKYCTQSDHNRSAPKEMFANETPDESCQMLVDQFFSTRQVTQAPPPSVLATESQPTNDDPYTGIFRSLVKATTAKVQAEIVSKRGSKTGSNLADPVAEAKGFKSVAEKFLKEAVAFARNDPSFTNPPTPEQLKGAIDLILRDAAEIPGLVPDRIKNTGELATRLETKARELAQQFLGGEIPNGSSSASRSSATKTVSGKLIKELESFVADSLGLNVQDFPSDQKKLKVDEKRYIAQIANAAISPLQANSEFSRFRNAAQLHIQLSATTAQNVLDVANAVDTPGGSARRVELRDLNLDLLKLAIPGRPYNRFGRRRTKAVAPLAIYPEFDRVALQSDPNVLYATVRDIAFSGFGKLIRRERLEMVDLSSNVDNLASALVTPLLGDADAEQNAIAKLSADERRRLLARVFAQLTLEIRRNMVENIIVLVPPGGFPEDIGSSLEPFRDAVLNDSDVRVDLIVAASGTVPRRLRDLSVRSGGIVMSVADIDEIGVAAQRLRTEGVSGSWVIAPHKGTVYLKAMPRDDIDKKRPAPDWLAAVEKEMAREDLNGDDVQKLIRCISAALLVEAHDQPSDQDTGDSGSNPPSTPASQAPQAPSALPRAPLAPLAPSALPQGIPAPPASALPQGIPAPPTPQDSLAPNADLVIKDSPTSARMGNHRWPNRKSMVQKNITTNVDDAKNFNDYGDFSFRVFEDDRSQSIRMFAKTLFSKGKAAIEKGQPGRDLDLLERTASRLEDLSNSIERIRESLWMEDAIPTKDELARVYQKIVNARGLLVRLYLADDPKTGEPLIGSNHLIYHTSDIEKITKFIYDRSLFRETEEYERSRRGSDKIKYNDIFKGYNKYKYVMLFPEYYTIRLGISQSKDGKTKEYVEKKRKSDSAGGKPSTDWGLNLRSHRWVDCELAMINARVYSMERYSFNRQRGGLGSPEDTQKSTKIKTVLDDLGGRSGVQRDPVPDEFNEHEQREFREILYNKFPLMFMKVDLGLLVMEDAVLSALNRSTPVFQRIERQDEQTLVEGDYDSDSQIDVDDALFPIELKKFKSEPNADFEFIVGVSRPLDKNAILADHPHMVLFDSYGRETSNEFLQLDEETTTETMMVFKLPNPAREDGRLPQGEYTPKLFLKRKHFIPHLFEEAGKVNFTFSIATEKPNILIIPGLRQVTLRAEDGAGDGEREAADRGTIANTKNAAIVEVQVMAGASIKGAEVSGSFMRVDASNDSITSKVVAFKDDGLGSDTTADDGVYTGRIVLVPEEQRVGSEYRVFIEARSVEEKTAFVSTSEFSQDSAKGDGNGADAKSQSMPKVPPFQRATSLNFRAEKAQ